jgi:hypothetical protein
MHCKRGLTAGRGAEGYIHISAANEALRHGSRRATNRHQGETVLRSVIATMSKPHNGGVRRIA